MTPDIHAPAARRSILGDTDARPGLQIGTKNPMFAAPKAAAFCDAFDIADQDQI